MELNWKEYYKGRVIVNFYFMFFYIFNLIRNFKNKLNDYWNVGYSIEIVVVFDIYVFLIDLSSFFFVLVENKVNLKKNFK